MIELICIATLAGLIVFQQLYWMRQIQKLIDKLMSKNYADYIQATAPSLPPRHPFGDITVRPEEVLEDLGVLNAIQVR